MLYHTGARNYACELCGNKFFQMEHLKRHMQSIHNFISSSNQSTSSNFSSKLEKKLKRKIIYEEKSETPTIDLAKQSDQTNTVTKCDFNCRQCDFSSVKMISLNEHIMSKHASCYDKNDINQEISHSGL